MATSKGQGSQPNALRGGISSLKLSLIAMEECSKKTKIGIPYKNEPVFVSGGRNRGNQCMIAQEATDNRSLVTNMIAGIAASRFKRPLGKNFVKTNEIGQKEEYCLRKIQAIYSILCSLQNIKSRDLKSKTQIQSSLLDYMSHKYRQESSRGSRLSPQHIKSQETYIGNVGDKRLANIFADSSTKIPPWQMQIVFIDEKAEGSEGDDIQLKLESCYERHRQLKTDFSWKMREEIEERERMSAHLLEVKLQELQFGPNPIRQFKIMREKARHICSQEKDNKPLWYASLRTEIESVLESKAARMKGDELLEQLNVFTNEEPSAISHVLEKFCLLAMSTPAHELCTVSVIDAIKFVLEKILSTSSKLCKQWLELRQLPWQQFFY